MNKNLEFMQKSTKTLKQALSSSIWNKQSKNQVKKLPNLSPIKRFLKIDSSKNNLHRIKFNFQIWTSLLAKNLRKRLYSDFCISTLDLLMIKSNSTRNLDQNSQSSLPLLSMGKRELGVTWISVNFTMIKKLSWVLISFTKTSKSLLKMLNPWIL